MPVIVLLHGSGRSGISLVEKWRPLADREGLILIGPTSQGNGWDLEADPASVVGMTLRDAARKHPIDTNRIYLFGHSAGGMYGNYLILKRPEFFAAAAFHAGSLLDASHYSDTADLSRKAPVLFILGDGDGLYGTDIVRSTAVTFARHGHQTEIQIIEGHDHWYYDISGFLNHQVWNFLKPHRL
jgi:poly(3-hydroxybutyrate) depolymerase